MHVRARARAGVDLNLLSRMRMSNVFGFYREICSLETLHHESALQLWPFDGRIWSSHDRANSACRLNMERGGDSKFQCKLKLCNIDLSRTRSFTLHRSRIYAKDCLNFRQLFLRILLMVLFRQEQLLFEQVHTQLSKCIEITWWRVVNTNQSG